MKHPFAVNKIILDILGQNIDRLPEHEVEIFQSIELELVDKALNTNETDWKSLRTYWKTSLVYQVFKRTFRLSTEIYEKLTYPHLLKLNRIQIKYYRGNTTYSAEQLKKFNNLTRYDIKPGTYDADISKTFKNLNNHSRIIKINLDDPGFANMFKDDMKHFLLKKSSHEKERKEKNKNKRQLKLTESSRWIACGDQATSSVSVPVIDAVAETEEDNYVIEDDEEDEERAAQELETVDVNAWLTLMSQDDFCLSPVVVEAESTDAVQPPNVDVRLSTNATDETSDTAAAATVATVPTTITELSRLQKLVIAGLKTPWDYFQHFCGDLADFRDACIVLGRPEIADVRSDVIMKTCSPLKTSRSAISISHAKLTPVVMSEPIDDVSLNELTCNSLLTCQIPETQPNANFSEGTISDKLVAVGRIVPFEPTAVTQLTMLQKLVIAGLKTPWEYFQHYCGDLADFREACILLKHPEIADVRSDVTTAELVNTCSPIETSQSAISINHAKLLPVVMSEPIHDIPEMQPNANFPERTITGMTFLDKLVATGRTVPFSIFEHFCSGFPEFLEACAILKITPSRAVIVEQPSPEVEPIPLAESSSNHSRQPLDKIDSTIQLNESVPIPIREASPAPSEPPPELELNVYVSSSESLIPETPVPMLTRKRVKRTRRSMDSKKSFESSISKQEPVAAAQPAETRVIISDVSKSLNFLDELEIPQNTSHSKEEVTAGSVTVPQLVHLEMNPTEFSDLMSFVPVEILKSKYGNYYEIYEKMQKNQNLSQTENTEKSKNITESQRSSPVATQSEISINDLQNQVSKANEQDNNKNDDAVLENESQTDYLPLSNDIRITTRQVVQVPSPLDNAYIEQWLDRVQPELCSYQPSLLDFDMKQERSININSSQSEYQNEFSFEQVEIGSRENQSVGTNRTNSIGVPNDPLACISFDIDPPSNAISIVSTSSNDCIMLSSQDEDELLVINEDCELESEDSKKPPKKRAAYFHLISDDGTVELSQRQFRAHTNLPKRKKIRIKKERT